MKKLQKSKKLPSSKKQGRQPSNTSLSSAFEPLMVVRIIAYDFAIALEHAVRKGAPYEMRFPEYSVLFLRDLPNQNGKMRMRVKLPSGQSFMYETSVVLAQSYDREEIFAKRLLVLLLFYIMRYEDVSIRW